MPSGLADTPADHTLHADSIRRVAPSESLTVSPSRSTSTTLAPSCISTPSFCSRACAFVPSLAPIGASTADPASSRITRACVESIWRKAPFSVWAASSAIWPANSTPVGPRTDDGERQQLLPEDRIAAQFSQLERAEDAPAHFKRIVDRLHARRELREMVVTEIGLAGAGRDDQAVVRRLIALPEQPLTPRIARPG